jgi:O-antigen/teichoic acid export membrane protein
MSSDETVGVLDTPVAGGKVIRGGVLRIVGYAAGLLLAVGAAALMTRHLGVANWGRYVAVLSLVSIVGSLSEAGMSAIGVREYVVLSGEERERVMRNLLGLRLALTVLGIGAAVIFAVAAGYGSTLVLGTLASGAALLFTSAQQTISVPLSASLRLGLVTAFDFARQAVFVAVVVALVVAGAGLFPFLAAPLPVAVLVLALTVPFVRGLVPLRPGFDPREWGRVLRLTIAYAAVTAVGTIYVSITVILISLVGSGKETGYYGASFRIISVLAVLPLLLVGSAFPLLARVARDDVARHQYARQRLLEVSLISGVWLALCLSLGASVAIDLVAGPKFEPSVAVLRIQAWMMIGTFVAIALGFVLLSLRRHKALLVANGLALATSVTLTLVLVPSLGARGAAIAAVAGELGLALLYGFALLRGSSGRISLKIVPAVLLASGLALALLAIPGLRDALLVLAATGVYFGTLLVTRAIPPELLEALRAWRTGSG